LPPAARSRGRLRYATTGVPDSTFSGDGELVINFTSGADEGYGLALQPADGKIVIAGTAADREDASRPHASTSTELRPH